MMIFLFFIHHVKNFTTSLDDVFNNDDKIQNGIWTRNTLCHKNFTRHPHQLRTPRYLT